MSGYEDTEPRLRCVLPFDAEPAEVPLLRKAVAVQLSEWGQGGSTEETELLVTELVTNVIKHVGEGVSATLILELRHERLRVEVHDKSPVIPSPRTPDCDEEGGRGLFLLAALAVDWGAVVTTVGKAVWCEIPLDPNRHRLRIERAVGVLASYQDAHGGAIFRNFRRKTGLEYSAIELIADLLHWTAARGCDPDEMLERAQLHYEAEVDAA